MKYIWYALLIGVVIGVLLYIFRKKAEKTETTDTTENNTESNNYPDISTGTAEFLFKSIPKTVKIYR